MEGVKVWSWSNDRRDKTKKQAARKEKCPGTSPFCFPQRHPKQESFLHDTIRATRTPYTYFVLLYAETYERNEVGA